MRQSSTRHSFEPGTSLLVHFGDIPLCTALVDLRIRPPSLLFIMIHTCCWITTWLLKQQLIIFCLFVGLQHQIRNGRHPTTIVVTTGRTCTKLVGRLGHLHFLATLIEFLTALIMVLATFSCLELRNLARRR